MNFKKYLKISLFSIVGLIPLTTSTFLVSACGSKATPPAKVTFADFVVDAKAESIVDIVAQTQPEGWGQLPDNDLFISSGPTSNPIRANVTIMLKSNSIKNEATFVATFHNRDYAITDWKCSIPPIPPIHNNDFNHFAILALKAPLLDIVKQTKPTDWGHITDSKNLWQYQGSKSNANNSGTVTTYIYENMTNEVATFVATYVYNEVYAITDWKCSIAPQAPNPDSFAGFVKSAKTESCSKIVNAIKPKGWEKLPPNDLSIVGTPTIDISKKTFSIILKSKSQKDQATFVATYHNAVYVIGDWKCNRVPTHPMTWEEFQAEVIKWSQSNLPNSGASVTIKDVLTYLAANDPKFPTPWKTMIKDSKHSFNVTALGKPNDDKQSITYTMIANPPADKVSYKCQILIQQDGGEGLSVNNFSITKATPSQYSEEQWFNDQSNNLVLIGSYTYPMIQAGHDAMKAIKDNATLEKTPNLYEVFNNPNNKYENLILQYDLDDGKTNNFPSPATPGSAPGNTSGQIQFCFEIILYNGQDNPTVPLTFGGIFYINWTDTSKEANIDQDFKNVKILQDVELK